MKSPEGQIDPLASGGASAGTDGSHEHGLRRGFADRVRAQETPFYAWLYRTAKRVRGYTLPSSRLLGALLAGERQARHAAWRWVKNQYCSQIMAYRCTSVGRNVVWGGEPPLVYGSGEIHIGDDVTIGNRQTWVVGLKFPAKARLVIGEGTTINYSVTISVAHSVIIGKYCLLAGDIKIFDNNSHPIDYLLRRGPHSLSAEDVAPVVIEDDVWIGNNCLIMKGVRIGRGAVVAAGAVVTKDVPPLTVVGGNPARVLKTIDLQRD